MGRFAYERSCRSVQSARGFTPMFIAAAISVLALLAVIGWQIRNSSQGVQAVAPVTAPTQSAPAISEFTDIAATSGPYALISGSDAASSSDNLSQLGDEVLGQLLNGYDGLQSAGIYSTSTADAVAQQALPLLQTNISYTTYAPSDIKTDSNTSYARMLTYRSALQVSLAPLLKSTTPEYELFDDYLQSNDATYLTQLSTVAQNYRDAVALTAKVVVPQDAGPYHVAILNAMQEFAATIDSLVAHANDPFTSAALLQNYNQAESDMVTSFNALATYYRSKQP